MKKKILLLTITLFTLFIHSQEEKKKLTKNYINPVNFSEVYNSYITNTISGDKNFNTLSSYVSVDVVKPELNIALSLNHRRNDKIKGVTTLNLNAKSTNGTGIAFKNGTYNFGGGIKLEHNYIIDANFLYTKEHESKKRIKTEAIENLLKLNIKLQKKIKERIEKTDTSEIEKLYKYNIELEKLRGKEEELKSNSTSLDINADWSTIKLHWFSFFADYNKQKFRAYDLEKEPTKKFFDITPESYSLGIGYNLYYNQNKIPKNYKCYNCNRLNGIYSIKYSFSKTNNINELIKDAFKTETILENVSNRETFYSIESEEAYNKNQIDYFNTHKFEINLNKKIKDFIHINLTYDFNILSNSKKYNGSYENLSIGALFSIRDKNNIDKKTYLNIQPFIQFKDLNNKFKNKDYIKFYERNIIGIRTTVPFGNLMTKK